MKRVTTNMSFGQLLFVLLTILITGGAGFYLGVKLGPQVSRWQNPEEQAVAFLPEDELAVEIQKLLASTTVDYSFFEVVQDKKNYPSASQAATEIPMVKIDFPKEEPAAMEESLLPVAKEEPKPTEAEKNAVAKVEEPMTAPVVEEKLKPEVLAAKVETPKVEPAKVEPIKKTEQPAEIKEAPAEEDSQELAKSELSQTKYLLQVGSYDSAKKAEKAKSTWEKRGYKPEIVVAQIPGKGQWFRLRLGLYDDYDQIQSHQKNIQKKYRESAVILPIQ